MISILELINDIPELNPDYVFTLPDNSNVFSSFFRGIIDTLNYWLHNMIWSMKIGINGIYKLFLSLMDVKSQIEYLTTHNAVSVDNSHYLILNQYIGNIRWCVGDLVFTEIYIMLLVGAVFFYYKLLFKAFDAFRYIKRAILGNGLGNLFDGLGSKIGSFFN